MGPRSCANCGSFQIIEKHDDDGKRAKLYLHCKACRHDLVFLEGTSAEVRKFKRLRRLARRRAS